MIGAKTVTLGEQTQEESPTIAVPLANPQQQYLNTIIQTTHQLVEQGLIDSLQNLGGPITQGYTPLLATVGDTTANTVVMFTHTRHGVELTDILGINLIKSNIFQSSGLARLINDGKLAIQFVFCSNPNGILKQTRNLGDETGKDIMRASKIEPHHRSVTTLGGITDVVVASRFFSGDVTTDNHLSEDDYPLPPEAKVQQDLIGGHIQQGKTVFHVDVHTDPTEHSHRLLFSPAHQIDYTKILDGQQLGTYSEYHRDESQAARVDDFYEKIRWSIYKQQLPLKYSQQQYRSVGDPVDYMLAKTVRDSSYGGIYQSVTYEIPTLKYVLQGGLNGKLRKLLSTGKRGEGFLNPAQVYSIPEQYQNIVSQKYTHNITALLTDLLQ